MTSSCVTVDLSVTHVQYHDRGERFHGNGGGGGGATQAGQNSVITTSATSFAGSFAGNGGDGIKIDSTNLVG